VTTIMTDDICMMPATELLRLYRQRRLSPVEATRAVLDRIERHAGPLATFRLVDADGAIDAARASEGRWMKGAPQGLVDGVPTTIKYQWLVKGWTTRRGSATTSDETAPEDSPAVARLRAHGAVLIGKTTLPEFGWKGVGDSPLTGIARNPWNPAKTPGGSSAGAAAAAAAGFGHLHHGSDGAGSIRMPAAFCGVFGLKPTFARVPAWPYGSLPMCSHTGPLTRTVADAALMTTVMTEPDHRDWLAPPAEKRDFAIGLEDGVRGLRIAYSRTLGHARVDPEYARLVEEAVTVFQAQGAVVEAVDPEIEDVKAPFIAFYASNMAATLRKIPPARRAEMDPGYAAFAARADGISGADLIDAWMARDRLGVAMARFHERFDLLLTPQLALAAFDVGRDYPEGVGMDSWFDWSPFTYPFNWTMQPAASVPCGLTTEGLPVALQLVAARHRDDLVLRAARAFESARPFAMPGVSKLGT
jgi:aspartyl-tRNA(Asn)/glutamyl-tRNA(Gln) amidotransferase subunit A